MSENILLAQSLILTSLLRRLIWSRHLPWRHQVKFRRTIYRSPVRFTIIQTRIHTHTHTHIYIYIYKCVCVLNSDIILFSTIIFRPLKLSIVSKIWKENNIIFRRRGNCICCLVRQMCESTYLVQSVQLNYFQSLYNLRQFDYRTMWA